MVFFFSWCLSFLIRPADTMVNYTCAAKHLCGMNNSPMETPPRHHCMECGNPQHSANVCGYLWCQRPSHMRHVTEDMLSERVKEKGLFTSVSSTMCFFCALDYDEGDDDGDLKPAAKPVLRRSVQSEKCQIKGPCCHKETIYK